MKRGDAQKFKRLAASPEETAQTRDILNAAQKLRRAGLNPEEVAQIRDIDTCARSLKRQRVCGPLEEVSDGSPTDLFLSKFESCEVAAQALFWKRNRGDRLSEFRGRDFQQLTVDEADVLKMKMTSLGVPSEDDIANAMKNYKACMMPTWPAQCCASCGFLEVAVDRDALGTSDFVDVTSVGPYVHCVWMETGISINNVFTLGFDKLRMLEYTAEQETDFCLPVPKHIEDKYENHVRWDRFKAVKSQQKAPVET